VTTCRLSARDLYLAEGSIKLPSNLLLALLILHVHSFNHLIFCKKIIHETLTERTYFYPNISLQKRDPNFVPPSPKDINLSIEGEKKLWLEYLIPSYYYFPSKDLQC
jgi:hypothetical protein